MEIFVLYINLKITGLLLCLSILYLVEDCHAYKKSPQHSILHGLTNCAGGGHLCAFDHKDFTKTFKPKCIHSFQRCNGFKDCPEGDDEKDCRCNELPSVKFGRFQLAIPGNDTLGALANVHCEPGYVARGKSSIKCSITTSRWGFWFGFCEQIKCRYVPQVENGQFILFGKGVIGDVSVLTCNKGYYSTSDLPTIISCLLTGQWTDNNDKCVIKGCGMLPNIFNGVYEMQSGNEEIGSIGGLKCDLGGFGIVDLIQCQADGTWKTIANRKCDGLIEDIRLVDGSNIRRGRLELFINGIWGTVCGSSFSIEEANVACKMLGFLTDNPTQMDSFGGGSGPIWLTGLSCVGTEMSLLDCQRSPLLGTDDCGHEDDVLVSCE